MRKRKDDSVAFMARVRVMRDGATYHETETFDTCAAATSRIEKRVPELIRPGVIAAYKAADPPPAGAIDRYTKDPLKKIVWTKAQVPGAIKNFPIAEMPCSAIKSKDIIDVSPVLHGSTPDCWQLCQPPGS